MRALLPVLLFMALSSAASADQKISQLPVGSAAAASSTDSFPFVNSTLGATERMTLFDLLNLPPFVSAFAAKVDTMGAFGSSPNSNGASIAGSTLTLQPADGTHPGSVSATTQTLGGNKTFSGQTSISNSSTTALTVNSTSFVVDATNNGIGVGIAPDTGATVDVVNNSGGAKVIQSTGYGGNIGYRGRYANGTSGSPTAALNGNFLNFLSGRGYGTTGFPSASTGSLNIVAGGTFTDSSMPTYLQFMVTPTGSITSSEAARIGSTGNVLVGTTTDNGTDKLQVNGGVSVGTVHAGVWNGTVTAGSSFLTSGTTYTTPSGITTATQFKFTLVGGGGGGGGMNTANGTAPGGGAGATCIVYLTGLAPSTAYTIAIGAAGTAGAATPTAGGNGGNTTLSVNATTYTAGGGTGGAGSVSSPGGAGGTCTNTTINITGRSGDGTSAASSNTPGAGGGSTQYGPGGARVGTGNGSSATGYGGGGAGGVGTGATGGAGTQGMILVEWKN